MTNITEILDQEPGIQYQGVKDKSGGTGTYPIIGLIVGQFKRGRFDKPMMVTNENIKGILGYDPKNPHYLAVQDALNQGVPSVQVVRQPLKAADYAYLTMDQMLGSMRVIVNGSTVIDTFDSMYDFIDRMSDAGIEVYNSYDSLGCFRLFRFQNATNQVLKVVFEDCYNWIWGVRELEGQENRTIKGRKVANQGLDLLEEGYSRVAFTLTPNEQAFNVPAKKVLEWGNESVTLYSKNPNNQSYNYRFWVDDQPVTSLVNGSQVFTIANTQANESEILNAFRALNVRLDSSQWSEGLALYFGPDSIGRKVTIVREGVNVPGEYQLTNQRYFVASLANGQKYEFYLYDPIDLEEN